MWQKIEESAACIAEKTKLRPTIGIILGTGLGGFADEISIALEIPYSDIPHFPESTVEGHRGCLLFGHYEEVPLVMMQGRIHYYEGFSAQEIAYPVRLLSYLGVDTLFLTNAAGGMNPDFEVGDLMIVTDHINLIPNPLIGNNRIPSGPRFPDMSEAYDREMIALAGSVAGQLNIAIKYGIYVGVTGPSYETPAEYACFRRMGGDAVGMSTTPEVIVARQMNVRCFAVSVITDLGIAGRIEHLTHQMVQQAAMAAEPSLARMIKEMLKRL